MENYIRIKNDNDADIYYLPSEILVTEEKTFLKYSEIDNEKAILDIDKVFNNIEYGVVDFSEENKENKILKEENDSLKEEIRLLNEEANCKTISEILEIKKIIDEKQTKIKNNFLIIEKNQSEMAKKQTIKIEEKKEVIIDLLNIFDNIKNYIFSYILSNNPNFKKYKEINNIKNNIDTISLELEQDNPSFNKLYNMIKILYKKVIDLGKESFIFETEKSYKVK